MCVVGPDLKSSPGSLWTQVQVHGQKLGQDQGQAYTKPPTRCIRAGSCGVGGGRRKLWKVFQKGRFESGASGLFQTICCTNILMSETAVREEIWPWRRHLPQMEAAPRGGQMGSAHTSCH